MVCNPISWPVIGFTLNVPGIRSTFIVRSDARSRLVVPYTYLTSRDCGDLSNIHEQRIRLRLFRFGSAFSITDVPLVVRLIIKILPYLYINIIIYFFCFVKKKFGLKVLELALENIKVYLLVINILSSLKKTISLPVIIYVSPFFLLHHQLFHDECLVPLTFLVPLTTSMVQVYSRCVPHTY